MNQEKQCPTCGYNIKVVPAGTSKKGNPYPAFTSCTNRDCKWTGKADGLPTIEPETPIGHSPTDPSALDPGDVERILGALRTLYKKIDDLENKLVDKSMNIEDLERKIDEVLNK